MKTIINGVFVVLALVSPAWAQDSEADFLAVAEASEAAAVEANAALLAPGSYERGRKEIERARVASRNGENSERTREQLLRAKIFFDEAVAASQTAQITFSNALVVREAAEIADAPELANDLWLKSEKELGAAASSLERNRIESALKQVEKSAELYGRAELAAIKTAVLAEAKQALQRAEQQRVQRYAPRTFAMVNELLAEAEQLLDQDRYNTKRARLLAQQATEEAGHSIFIAESVWMVRDKQLTLEELVLKWEERLQRVAVSAGVTLEMNRSSDDVAAELASRVAQLNRSEKSLREDFSDAQQYIAAQEEEIRDLDHKIRGASAERETLVLELEAQARAREQIIQLQNMFEDHEALVMRESNVVILRLVGLQFESGSADIDTGNQQLLDKIERAIDIYPRCEVVVEGHTDSSGGDALNTRLSQERAESVRTFLTVNGHIPGYRISAVGYGDTRPIANNKTKAGRDRNRRIDLLIIPNERAAAYQ